MPYGFFITDKGRELIDKAIPTESKVEIVKACFGSGGDPESPEDFSRTELNSQFYEKPLSPETDSYRVDENDPYSLFIASEVPGDVTGVFNEIGYKDSEDNLIIYGVVQERVKTPGVQGGLNKLRYENWIKLENGDTATIDIHIKTPEYEKVEELVQKAEYEFDIRNYVTQDQLREYKVIEPIPDEKIQEIIGMELPYMAGSAIDLEDIEKLLDDDPSNDPESSNRNGVIPDSLILEMLGD